MNDTIAQRILIGGVNMKNKTEKPFLIKNIGGPGLSSSVTRLIIHQKKANENDNLPFTIVEENDDEDDKKE